MTSVSNATPTSAAPSATYTGPIFQNDPYLVYQPSYAYSLPVQILLLGMVCTLTGVLLTHLIFTAPYHWPIAKLNYGLQLSGVVSLLVSTALSLVVVLRNVHQTSRSWPYMLNYIGVQVPIDGWALHAIAWWYGLDAVTSGLAHMTHIQFLTLLYPSVLERRLILLLLGPLAIASSASSFVALSSKEAVHDIGESMRNICNSALALLFTIALCVWGFFINRKEAWRTDGGTAIFGAGAIFLAFCSTALNLVTIPLEPPGWMPNLVWVVVLWQSFMGWWWWVGSGMPPASQEEKKKKRKPIGADGEVESPHRLARFKSGISSAGGMFQRKRNRGGEDTVLLSTEPLSSSTDSTPTAAAAPEPPPPSQGFTLSGPLALRGQVVAWWDNLRHAHSHATRMQALEQRRHRSHVYGNQNTDAPGWNLGSYAVRERDFPRTDTRTVDSVEMDVFSSERANSTADDTVQHSASQYTSGGRSWLWWGPLGRWRLQDVSVYH